MIHIEQVTPIDREMEHGHIPKGSRYHFHKDFTQHSRYFWRVKTLGVTFTPVTDAGDQTDMCAGQNLCWTSLMGGSGGRKGTKTVVDI